MRPIGDLPAVEPALSDVLAGITDRAHRLRSRGLHDKAERLLRKAADHRVLPAHVGQGLHALADLFRAHPDGPAGASLPFGRVVP